MSEEKPKISIVMPVYNAQRHVDKAIESVLAQTFSEFELIMIDDGSTDGSVARLQHWALSDQRLRLLKHEANKGISASRNLGIKQSRASLIAFLDADDTWVPEKLLIQYEHHHHTQCAFSCTAFWFGASLVRSKPMIRYRDLLINNTVNTSTVLINAKRIPLNFSAAEKSEDYIEWLRVSQKHPIHFINEPLAVRRVFSGVSANKGAMARQRWRIYRDTEKLNVILSAYYFMCYTITGFKKYWPIFIGKATK